MGRSTSSRTPGLVSSMFDEVASALRGGVAADLGRFRTQPRRWGVKVWFEAEDAPRQHYEAQVIGARYVAEATVLALEIGFHAEHRDPERNEELVRVLADAEPSWRPVLPDAVLGPFLGRAPGWRRLSETWADPDLGDPDVVLEVADRLVAYIETLQPLLPP